MKHADRARWEPRFARWGARLRALRLDGLAVALLDAAGPLRILGAQMLYIAQPALGLFGGRDTAGELARLLEDPDSLAYLRDHLTAVPPNNAGDDEGDDEQH